ESARQGGERRHVCGDRRRVHRGGRTGRQARRRDGCAGQRRGARRRRGAQAGRGRLGELRLRPRGPRPLRGRLRQRPRRQLPPPPRVPRGSMQVVEWQGRRWLSDAGDGEFYIELPEVLPERFTIEFDVVGSGNPLEMSWGENGEGVLYIDESSDWARAGGVEPRGGFKVNTEERPARIRIAVDGDYLKLYADEHRALNAPNLKMGRSNRIRVVMNGWSAESPRMIADLRIMAGGQTLYDALVADGRVATPGIYFDTGSDRLRPESTPTLEEIADMLKAHPDLRIRIEGHTDSTGNP